MLYELHEVLFHLVCPHLQMKGLRVMSRVFLFSMMLQPASDIIENELMGNFYKGVTANFSPFRFWKNWTTFLISDVVKSVNVKGSTRLLGARAFYTASVKTDSSLSKEGSDSDRFRK